MIPAALRQAAAFRKQSFNVYTNPYKAKKAWPPDFAKLSPKQQFRLERRYKRRAQLKWARPGWTKAMKLAQWGGITFVVIYGVLFMDWGSEANNPFRGFRSWVQGKKDAFWTAANSKPPRQSPSSAVPSPSEKKPQP